MAVRVGINGFGRIGRNFFRAARARGADIEFVAVNDLGSLTTMAHLLKYDSVLGVLPNKIEAVDGGISVDGTVLKVLSERDPKNLPWGAPVSSLTATRPLLISTQVLHSWSCPHRLMEPMRHSCTESIIKTSIRRSTKWCRMPVAPPTVSFRW
jgi:hypothetical protein